MRLAGVAAQLELASGESLGLGSPRKVFVNVVEPLVIRPTIEISDPKEAARDIVGLSFTCRKP